MILPYDRSHWVQDADKVLLRMSVKSKFIKLAIVCVICLMFLTAIVLLFQALTA